MNRSLLASVLTVGLFALTACSTPQDVSKPPLPAATLSTAASETPDSTSSPAPATPTVTTDSPTPRATTGTPTTGTTAATPSTVVEPTTTNTLPPPPRPSRPAPSTAGRLSASSLPIPPGWKTIIREGGSEEGYQGNGTWVHARDPRYAARDVITMGCTEVTRDDYPDPTAALEGTYERKKGEPGIGLVLQFSNQRRARMFFDTYADQVTACERGDGPVVTRIIPSEFGLIDRRSYPDGKWTEVGRLLGERVTLIILADPGHAISKAQSERLLQAIPGR